MNLFVFGKIHIFHCSEFLICAATKFTIPVNDAYYLRKTCSVVTYRRKLEEPNVNWCAVPLHMSKPMLKGFKNLLQGASMTQSLRI